MDDRKKKIEQFRKKTNDTSFEETISEFQKLRVEDDTAQTMKASLIIKENILKNGMKEIKDNKPKVATNIKQLCEDEKVVLGKSFGSELPVEHFLFTSDTKRIDYMINGSEFIDVMISTRDFSAILFIILYNPPDLPPYLPLSYLKAQYEKFLMFAVHYPPFKIIDHMNLVKDWLKRASKEAICNDEFSHFMKHAKFVKAPPSKLSATNVKFFLDSLYAYPVDQVAQLGIDQQIVWKSIGSVNMSFSEVIVQHRKNVIELSERFLSCKITPDEYYNSVKKESIASLRLTEAMVALVMEVCITNEEERCSGIGSFINRQQTREHLAPIDEKGMTLLNQLRAKYLQINRQESKDFNISSETIKLEASHYPKDTSIPTIEYLQEFAAIQLLNWDVRDQRVAGRSEKLIDEGLRHEEQLFKEAQDMRMKREIEEEIRKKRIFDSLNQEVPELDVMEFE